MLDALKPAPNKRYEVSDTKISGLHVRVSNAGAKVFYISKRVDGRRRRLKIGPYPVISLADARRRSMEIARDIELGLFEKVPDLANATCPTLGEIVPQFIERYAKPNTKDWKGTQSVLQKFRTLFNKPIDEVTRGDVVRVLDEIVASGTKTRANRALASLIFALYVSLTVASIYSHLGYKVEKYSRHKREMRQNITTERELSKKQSRY